MPKAAKAHAANIEHLAKDARSLSELLLAHEKLDETDRVLVEEKLVLMEKLGKAIWRSIRPLAVAAAELEKHGRRYDADRKWLLVASAIHSSQDMQDKLEEMIQLHDDLERMARHYGLLKPPK